MLNDAPVGDTVTDIPLRTNRLPICVNTTIRNSYKDEASGEWKETSSFSPTDLALLAQLSAQLNE